MDDHNKHGASETPETDAFLASCPSAGSNSNGVELIRSLERRLIESRASFDAAVTRLAEIEAAAQLPAAKRDVLSLNCTTGHVTYTDSYEALRTHALHLAEENLRMREEVSAIAESDHGKFLELEYLRKVHKAAHALYMESEEYTFDDGLGKGAGQQYWDDLALAFEPDTQAIADELKNSERLRAYVRVPEEPTKEMIEAAKKHSVEWAKTLRPLQPLSEVTWVESCIGRYKAMLDAARKEGK